jgi:formate dehydrogenase iron-sulfur subunit
MSAVDTNIGSRPPLQADHAREVDSFYHLSDVEIAQCACRGLACFVARHLNPQRWRQACAQDASVYCLGKCFAAPAHGADCERPACAVDAHVPIVLERIVNGGARSLDQYRRLGGYQSLEAALKQPPDAVIRAIEASGLRGRGGAGFPTGRKWHLTSRQSATPRYVIANADEGDPGAYIDRFILEDDPHCLIEGMAIAAHAVGASEGWIYLRCEYPAARSVLEKALAEARDAGFLGRRILGSDCSFDLQLHLGRGSYVCGEETALLNSIEGKRPVARARPPYAVDKGLFERPTLVNNVETLANIPWIVRQGGEAYHKIGFSNSRGTKVVSLNSLFNRPGLYEVEFGIPLRRIVEDLGGGLKTGTLKGVMVGGPLAGVVPPHLLDTSFGFEELRAISAAVGHGGVIAFDEHTSIPELIRHVFSFAASESCGKCVPCRLGARRVEQIFHHILANGSATLEERREWIEIINALKLASLCGLGSAAAEFAESVQRHYAKELEPCFA